MRRFSTFCHQHGSLPSPATKHSVAYFAAHLSLQGLAPSTISAYTAAVGAYHRVRGLQDPCQLLLFLCCCLLFCFGFVFCIFRCLMTFVCCSCTQGGGLTRADWPLGGFTLGGALTGYFTGQSSSTVCGGRSCLACPVPVLAIAPQTPKEING